MVSVLQDGQFINWFGSLSP